MQRPDFSEIKTYEEFSKYYWYREELWKIVRESTREKVYTHDLLKELNIL